MSWRRCQSRYGLFCLLVAGLADKRPVCKLCKAPHWVREPHVWKDGVTPSFTTVTDKVTPAYVQAPRVTETVTIASPRYAPVTKSVTAPSIEVTNNVTELEQENTFLRSEVARLTEELANLQPKTHAARQRTYRERHHSP